MVRAGSVGPSPSRSRHQDGIKGFDSIWENACEKVSKEPAKLGEPDSGDSQRGGEEERGGPGRGERSGEREK